MRVLPRPPLPASPSVQLAIIALAPSSYPSVYQWVVVSMQGTLKIAHTKPASGSHDMLIAIPRMAKTSELYYI
jgi:hypothetical protein